MIFKTLLSSLFIVIISSVHLFAQDIIDIAEKMRSLAILPFPHHFELPDSNIGVIIRFEDFERVTTEELAKLNKIETIQLQFDNQFELDRVVSLLPNFPSLKYLVLSNRINGDTTTKEIKLPEILASYKNIVGLKLSGNLKINYQHGLAIFNELPNLQFLFFEDFPQALPEDVRGFKQLKGISLRGRVISFPEWISKLPNLESIYLSMWNYHGSQSLDYADALKKLQKLPFLKSLYLSHIYKNEGTFDELKFKHLIKVELDHVNFKSNKQIMAFLANQRQLKSIRITGSSPESLDANFSKLKQLEHLSMSGTGESLSVNFNLKDLTNLKSLDIYNVKLLLNQTEFPDNLVHLKLEGTKLEGFPSSIIKLHKLKALLLSNNSITHLPDNFSDLNQLENLDLLRNGLKKLPGNFGDLRSLKKLELSGNPITELPESIGNLKSLKVFKLQYGDLRKLPMTLGGLQKLEVMNLSGNFITRIPETLQNIKTLKTLNLSHNQLLTLPQNIGNMSALEELILDFNNINRIPESIGRLQFIKKISLSFNDLNRLPDQISNLKTL
ncbi:leucine-rich repeat domain-containing protein, partial [Pedobacter sp.]|uniref:leucine-rich repeat domain-containing protein n=1 Tax=Pedobacter sp. TaxID=1411316 RepID=UPI003D7FDD46